MSEDLRIVAGGSADPGELPARDGTHRDSPQAAKPKKKVRSAWISFVSRILAQLIGAAATVALGVVALQRYQVPIARPADAAGVAPIAHTSPAARRDPGAILIAVLPFENYSGDSRQDHLADALTEGLVGELSRVGRLRVVSRTSSMRYRGARKPLPEIGRELGVDFLVEGSLVGDGAKVRVIAQLVDARRDEHLWAAPYLSTAQGVVALQTELAPAIASDVVDALKDSAQWQAVVPESRNVAPATGTNSQR